MAFTHPSLPDCLLPLSSDLTVISDHLTFYDMISLRAQLDPGEMTVTCQTGCETSIGKMINQKYKWKRIWPPRYSWIKYMKRSFLGCSYTGTVFFISQEWVKPVRACC